MSAPVYVAAGTFAETTGSALNVPYMGSLVAKDLAFLFVSNSQIGVSVGAPDTPSGWTAITTGASFRNGSAQLNGGCGLYWKLLDGTETGNVTVNRSGATGPGTAFIGRMFQFRGNGANLLVNSSFNIRQEEYGATVTWDTISGIFAESTLIAFSCQADTVPIDTPSGYTTGTSDNAANIGHMSMDYKEDVSSDGAVTAAGGDPDGWISIHLSIFNPKGRSFIVN